MNVGDHGTNVQCSWQICIQLQRKAIQLWTSMLPIRFTICPIQHCLKYTTICPLQHCWNTLRSVQYNIAEIHVMRRPIQHCWNLSITTLLKYTLQSVHYNNTTLLQLLLTLNVHVTCLGLLFSTTTIDWYFQFRK